jgi:hypothetical protein
MTDAATNRKSITINATFRADEHTVTFVNNATGTIVETGSTKIEKENTTVTVADNGSVSITSNYNILVSADGSKCTISRVNGSLTSWTISNITDDVEVTITNYAS